MGFNKGSNVVELKCAKLQCDASNKNILNGERVLYTDNVGAVYSVDDAVNKVGYGKFQIVLTCLTGLGWLADAIEIIILSLIGEFISCDWPLQRWQNALLTSTVFGGMMIGSPVFGTVADIYGRKKSLAGSVIMLFIFGAASAAAPSFTWMAIFRSCMGFALGGVAQGLTLCSEYVPSNLRGKAGFYLCYFWSLGTFAVILLTWVIMENFDSWRILLVATSVPALLVIICLKWFPESARYYLVSNQYDEAKKILGKMASMNGKELPSGNLVHVSHCYRRGRIADLLGKDYRRGTLLFWYIWLALAFAYYGIALVTPTIVKNGSLPTGGSNGNATAVSFYDDMTTMVPCNKYTTQNYIDLLWTSAAEFPGLIIFTFLIEHINRKVLLGTSCVISAILIFLLLVRSDYSFVVLLFLFGARAIILAVFQLVYVMTSEHNPMWFYVAMLAFKKAFPTTLRAIAMGTGTCFSRLGGLVVPYVAQVLVVQNPVAAISLLGGIILLAGVAAAFLPLETRGMHMQESHNSKG